MQLDGGEGGIALPKPSTRFFSLCLVFVVRFLELVRPFMSILPEVTAPERKVSHSSLTFKLYRVIQLRG